MTLGLELLKPTIFQGNLSFGCRLKSYYIVPDMYYKTFYGRNLRIFLNKLECLVLENPSSLVYWLWARPGERFVEHLKDISLG